MGGRQGGGRRVGVGGRQGGGREGWRERETVYSISSAAHTCAEITRRILSILGEREVRLHSESHSE